ncbi:MAG: phage/plasmid primase, P4 family [Liquorilactobacillus sp.]
MEFIILNDNKQPIHKFKDPSQTKTVQEVKDFDNYAVVVPKGYIVLDFDTTDDAEIMFNIVKELKLKSRVYKTKRGYHFWFKSSIQFKNFVKARLACGLYSDCRSGVNGDKRSYVVLKKNGIKRPVVNKVSLKDLDEVPAFLRPISTPADKFNFKEMSNGDGRNQQLFSYIVYLQGQGFKKDEIKDTIQVINDFVFDDSLGEHELSQILRDESFKPEKEVKKMTSKKISGFKHNVFGNELIKQYHILTVNNQLYVYDDGFYQQDDRIIERKMIEMFPGIKQTQRNEVLAYIRIETHKNPADIKLNPYIINLKNTRLDVRTGEKLDFDYKQTEFDRIPVVYDPEAYNSDVDHMLDKVFVNDQEIRELFEEMLGYCFIKNTRYRKGFMFVGGGHNGKSTILDMIKNFLGKRNYSSIGLDELADRFKIAELEHKLANIGDDINNVSLKKTGTIKKLFTGNSITVERKGERPFELEPYAKMIFSANEIPRSYDKTEGFYSRLMFIPFDAEFSADDEDYDPNIEDKITTDNAMSYLLNIALKGIQRLMTKGEFTQPQRVLEVMNQYRTDNSTTLSWVADQEITLEQVLETPSSDLYSDFADWCKQSGIKANNVTGKKIFNRELIDKFDLERRQKQHGDGKRYFVVAL